MVFVSFLFFCFCFVANINNYKPARLLHTIEEIGHENIGRVRNRWRHYHYHLYNAVKMKAI